MTVDGTPLNAAALLEERTSQVDAMVRAAWPHIEDTALVAVGGYGRRELFPYSDVDLLVLNQRVNGPAADDDLRNAIAPFVRDLWDAGLRVSQSVHTVAECLALDPENEELSVSLLDRRYLAGERGLFEQLRNPPRDRLAPALARLARARHRTFGKTIFHLEPHIKDAPGALRDLQVIRWLSVLEDAVVEPPRAESIYRIRVALHQAAGRDQNVLNFAMQDACAAASRLSDAAELMRAYYREAGPIFAACAQALERAEYQRPSVFRAMRERASELADKDFRVINGKVFFRQQAADPLATERLFAFVARHGTPIAEEARLRVASQTGAGMNWRQLRDILEAPHTGLALRAMHESGYLGRLFPAFQDIEWLVIRDFYHRYTVDEHSLLAVQTAIDLKSAASHFGELARETPDYPLLLVALLLHDSGKSAMAEEHAAMSAQHARAACHAIGMTDAETATVSFLIERHLDMSRLMTTRDPKDMRAAATLAALVGTVERLKMLTVLTYCDISSVNPTALTPWRATLLWQTYAAAERKLTLDLQEHVTEQGLPVRYQLTHTAEEIDEHLGMEREGRAVRLDRLGDQHRLTIVTRDRSFLIADVAGALAGFGMNILRAEAFVNERHFAIDTFVFADPMRTLDLNPSEVERFQQVVSDVIARRKEVGELLRGRRRTQRTARITARVSMDTAASQSATLFEIVAEDRPGILYDLSRRLSESGCNIETVLVDTEGQKVIDVFYVTREGLPLDEHDAAEVRKALEEITS